MPDMSQRPQALRCTGQRGTTFRIRLHAASVQNERPWGSCGETDTLQNPRQTSPVHSASDALRRADAGTYLEQCGALFSTGPTHTNVMDLLIAIVD